MSGEMVLYLGRRTLEMALMLASPVLVVTLVVGLVSALLQAVTSIRDMTLGLVLKIAAVGVTVLIFGGWMLRQAVGFTEDVFFQIQALGQ
ncbi:MAG: flagellar biosynthetic protein FliQ [Phycisphaerae bacterium]|nr:flagellar biosynthetic protein FliQ [Phycisphaerae bacterium]